jgi:hypothetical protein
MMQGELKPTNEQLIEDSQLPQFFKAATFVQPSPHSEAPAKCHYQAAKAVLV